MLFYWSLFIFIFSLVFISRIKPENKYHIIFIILLLLGASRAVTVGNDLNGGYSAEFKTIYMDPSTWGRIMGQFEIGFAWSMAFFKTYICSEGIYFFHLIFFITFVLCSRVIKRLSLAPSMSLFFLFGLGIYFSFYNTMRQHLCFSMILAFLPNLIRKRNYLSFTIVTIVISYFFHKSQVVLLAIIPILLFHEHKWVNTRNLIILLVISFVIGTTYTFIIFKNLSLLSFLYEGGNTNYVGYLTHEDNIGKFSNFSNILNTLFAIYCVYSHRFEKSLFLVLYVLGVVLLNLLTPISWIFMRIAFTFMFFRIFTYAYLWYKIPNKTERYIYRTGVLLYVVFMFYNRLINDNYQDVLPYINHYLHL